MIFVILVIAILYILLIVLFIIGFNRLKTVKKLESPPKHSFSIIVPFRNEAENLPQLLNSFQQLNYPSNLFEILFVNDASEDESCTIIKKFQQQFPYINSALLNNNKKTGSPKKDAINTAIKKMQFEWIVTTDADCVVPATWLQIFNDFIEAKNPVFISAPVKFQEQKAFLFHFQNLNFLSLIGTTIGSFGIQKPLMCNGANLCYQKEAFINVHGFDGNTTTASGDDVFLLEKMHKKYPNKTRFLKSTDALVLTTSEKNWNAYIHQQIRWASKATAYKSTFSKYVSLVVLLLNLAVITTLITAFFIPIYWKCFFVLFIQKISIDFILIQKTSVFLKSTNSLKSYVLIAFLYPFFTTFIGLFSIFKSYEWKGRTFKK